jgi:hypothetical protein
MQRLKKSMLDLTSFKASSYWTDKQTHQNETPTTLRAEAK